MSRQRGLVEAALSLVSYNPCHPSQIWLVIVQTCSVKSYKYKAVISRYRRKLQVPVWQAGRYVTYTLPAVCLCRNWETRNPASLYDSLVFSGVQVQMGDWKMQSQDWIWGESTCSGPVLWRHQISNWGGQKNVPVFTVVYSTRTEDITKAQK